MNSSPHFTLILSRETNSLEVWSKTRLPFEPKGRLRKLRAEIRRCLGTLHPMPRSVLTAEYISPLREACDVENVLFYNVGTGIFSKLASAGVRFERVFSPPPPLAVGVGRAAGQYHHYHRYGLSAGENEFTHWVLASRLAKWEKVWHSEAHFTSASVWHSIKLAARRGSVEIGQALGAPPDRLALRVIVHAPKATTINLVTVLKPIFDGSVAGFRRRASRPFARDLEHQRLGGYPEDPRRLHRCYSDHAKTGYPSEASTLPQLPGRRPRRGKRRVYLPEMRLQDEDVRECLEPRLGVGLAP